MQKQEDDWELLPPEEDDEWEILPPEPKKKKEQSRAGWWIEQGLRTAPAVAGSLIGGAGGLFGAGVGAVPGAMAGGAGGAAVGNLLGNWYGGDEFKPAEFAVETALGAVPPIFGAGKQVAGLGAKNLLKYGAKQAGSGAVEGALVSAGGTPFQHWAETGDFDAPIERYVQNASAGAVLGGALGGAIGTHQGKGQQARLRGPSKPPRIDVPPGVNLNKEPGPFPPVTAEDDFARSIQSVRDSFAASEAQAKGVELPPPPFSLGAPSPPEQPRTRFNVNAPRTPKDKPPVKKTAPPAIPAKPLPQPESVDPVTGEMSTSPSKVDEIFPGMTTEPSLRAKNVKKTQGKWRSSLTNFMKSEDGSADLPDFFGEDIGTMPKKSIDLNAEVNSLEPPIKPADWGDWGDLDATKEGLPNLINDETGSTVAAPLRGVNPLRPEVPAGQLTNKRMFELSEQRALEGQVSPGKQFADSVAPHEFDQDMMFTPDEMRSPEIPRMDSPVENQFDQRIAPGGGDNILEGAPERFGRQQDSDISNDMSQKQTLRHAQIEPNKLTDPQAQQWMDRIDELDAANAPESEYKKLFSTGAKYNLPKGDTWRGKALRTVHHFETRAQAAPTPEIAPPVDQTKGGLVGKDGQKIAPLETVKNWEQGGDTRPIREEMDRLDATQSADFRYKALLPKEMQYALEGDTYRQRLENLFQATKSLDDPELVARSAERDQFIRSVEPTSDIPPLKSRNVKDSLFEKPGRFGPKPNKDKANSLFGKIKNFLSDEDGSAPLSDDEPLFARTPEGRAKIGVDVEHAAGELTTGYSQPLPAIMVREGLQNSLDAVRDLGPNGDVSIRLFDKDGKPNTIEIQDNGKGMSAEELYTVYTDLHSSGKANDPNATGGKGVGKAPYMLGGEHFEVVTVKEIDGQKIESSFSGKPKELLAGFDIKSKVVPSNTPTGTKFKTTLKTDQDISYARYAIQNISEYSRGRNSKLKAKKYSFDTEEHLPWTDSSTDNKIISDENIAHAKMDAFIPENAELGNRTYINLEVLNNGMWQFRDTMYLNEAVNGIPSRIIVDIKPNVKEGTAEYPFPVQRETLKDNAKAGVMKLIQEKLVNPFASQRKMDLQKLWNQMTPSRAPGTHRESVFFDPGDRLTGDEKAMFRDSPVVKRLQLVIDSMINDILGASGLAANQKKVVRTGITLDPTMLGVHIPNPGAADAESAIFINIFQHMKKHPPENAAVETVITGLHESAHVGGDTPDQTVMSDLDLDDPRVGRYLQSYIQHTMEQGGIDMGHGMPFIKRLGDMYAKTGTKTSLRYADEFQEIITGGTGGYSPEVQELLRVYAESRGRTATSEDILSGTGIKQADRGAGTGSIPSNAQPVGGGATGRPQWLNNHMGQSSVPDAPKPKSMFSKAISAPKTTMSIDLPFMTSAAFRQAKPLAWSTQWVKAWGQAARAYGSQEASDLIHAEILKSPNFKGYGTGQSVAEKLGVELTGSQFTAREESIGTTFRTLENAPGIKQSNRAYAAFLNHLRQTKLDELLSAMPDPNDMVTAKLLGEFVMDATGRGKLKWAGPKGSSVSLEQMGGIVKTLDNTLWAPRLLAANTKFLNPFTYTSLPPQVRQEYIKSAIRMGVTWMGFAGLAKMAGGEVNLDPTNSDFGKMKFGNMRIDPAGGMQQLLVFTARELPKGVGAMMGTKTGAFTSSATGNTKQYGKGAFPMGREDVFEEFASSKLAPTQKLAWDLLRATAKKPVHFGDRMLQMALPIMAQDIMDLTKRDQDFAKMLGMGVASSVGMGTNYYGKGEKFGAPTFTDSIEKYLQLSPGSANMTVKDW